MNKIISISQIVGILFNVTQKGARPFSLLYRTEKKLLKKDRVTKEPNVLGDYVVKQTKALCFLNFNYEDSVNRQLGRENQDQTFEVKPNWFEHTNVKGVVKHKKNSNLYIQLKLENSIETHYYLPDGSEVSKESIENLLPVEYLPQNQGTEKPILTFTIALDNVLQFTVDKETYQVASPGTITVEQWAKIEKDLARII